MKFEKSDSSIKREETAHECMAGNTVIWRLPDSWLGCTMKAIVIVTEPLTVPNARFVNAFVFLVSYVARVTATKKNAFEKRSCTISNEKCLCRNTRTRID